MEELDPRLSAAVGLVRPGSVAADIGTDHGYLVCALVKSGRCPRGFACDINAQPLERARAEIDRQGLAQRIDTRLTNGLRGLPWGEIDDFILAGMGGDLISDILSAAPWTTQPEAVDKRYVLQPMTKAEHLRRWLYRGGFSILAERAVRSGRFVYAVLQAAYTGERREISDRFAWTGLLWEQSGRDALDYLEGVRRKVEMRAEGLAKAKTADKQELGRCRALLQEISDRPGKDTQ